jgi:hypothetical protein
MPNRTWPRSYVIEDGKFNYDGSAGLGGHAEERRNHDGLCQPAWDEFGHDNDYSTDYAFPTIYPGSISVSKFEFFGLITA